MATVEQVYGKAAAMRLRTEKAVMEQFTVRTCLYLVMWRLCWTCLRSNVS